MSQAPNELAALMQMMSNQGQPDMGEAQSPELLSLDMINKSHDLEDGSSVYHVGMPEPEEAANEPKDFYANLAEDLKEATLSALAGRLLEEIKQDKESRKDWENTITLMMKYLGIKVEEFSSVPFMRACSAFDSSLMIALLNFYSTARAELFPAAGPTRSEIIGTPTEQTEDKAERVRMFMNHYLTQIDKPYYPDSERLLMFVGFMGCAFKKVYQDPILNRPIARTIAPFDFIVDHNTTDLLTSSRMTQVIQLSRKDIILRQMSGDYVQFKIPTSESSLDDDDSNSIQKNIKRIEGINTDSTENKSLFKFYEVHVDLTKDDFDEDNELNSPYGDDASEDLPRPYVVTICEETKDVVSIRRNWKENDNTFARCEYFVHYYYQPGFGIYSLGLAHILGSNAIAMTSILRQSIDAEMLAMFPGGLKKRGMRVENNDKAVGPAEFHEVETGGDPISDCIMLMPYKGSSANALALLETLNKKSEAISAVNSAQIPESGTNTPVGTTLAMIEVANKAISSILRSLHVSLGNELKLLFKLFGEHMTDTPYPFSVPGAQTAIMKQDFSDDVNIVPVSDPNVLTSTHRLLRAEALLKIVQSKPEIHNLREAYERLYKAMNVENIDKLLPPPQEPQPPPPMDPLTEASILMTGKPIKAYVQQNHEAHNLLHLDAIQKDAASQQPNQQFQTAMTAHIQEHKAFAYLLEMQQLMQAEIPPEQALQDPQVQNAIALHAAEALKHQKEQEAVNNPPALDPNMVMLQDIEQRREASHLKHDEALMKTETEAYKAQLRFESEKEQRKVDMDIADEKSDVALAIAEMNKRNPGV